MNYCRVKFRKCFVEIKTWWVLLPGFSISDALPIMHGIYNSQENLVLNSSQKLK